MTAYDAIVAALEAQGMRTFVRSDGTRSQCPVHGSRGLTLSVRAGDGRAFVHCFAGCDDDEVLAAVGLAVRDLFDEPRGSGGTYVPPRREPTPWETALAGLGIYNGPSIDHVLNRMVVEEVKTGVICGDCLTPPSPWRCSCGALKVRDAG